MVTRRGGLVRVGCGFAVLAAAAGLLGMHGLTVHTSASSMHLRVPQASAIDSAGLAAVRVESSMASMGGNGHGLAACIWVLVGGISIALLGGVRLDKVPSRGGLVLPRAFCVAGQRGPPSSRRLSLVGVSRR